MGQRPGAGGWKNGELDRKDHDRDDRQPEIGYGGPDQRDHRGKPVEEATGTKRCKRSDDDGGHRDERHGDDRKPEGPGEGFQDDIESGIGRTYAEARRCLDALTALGGTGGTASLRELGFLGLLLADTPDTSAFIANTIGPVLEYDERQTTELTRTLEAYFTSGGSPSRAAESLHVHPNTVSRRLERITDLLGPGWQEPLQAVEVQLAHRLRRTRHTVRNHTGPPVLPHDELP